MKTIKYILLFIILIFSHNSNISYADGIVDDIVKSGGNSMDENIDNTDGGRKGKVTNGELKQLKGDDDWNFGTNKSGESGISSFGIKIAESVKEIFFWFATIYLMIITLRLLFAENSEEESGKFKKGVLWTTAGIIVMQGAFAFQQTLSKSGSQVGEKEAFKFIDNIINPLVGTMEILASVFFIGVAVFSFFKLITAGGDEEKVKSGRQSIIHAIMGFFVIMFAKIIVEGTYGKIEAGKLNSADPSSLVSYTLNIINWLNGFLAIIVVILIIYTGGKIMISRGDEETIKKAKSSIIGIIIGLFILTTNWFILTIFLVPEA